MVLTDVCVGQVNDVGMACELASGFAAEKACPIFRCSNVTGEGLDLLKVRYERTTCVDPRESETDAFLFLLT